MEKLTDFQKLALSKFPETGWYRVDDNIPDFWIDGIFRRTNFIAKTLHRKGYLECRYVTMDSVTFREYQKVNQEGKRC